MSTEIMMNQTTTIVQSKCLYLPISISIGKIRTELTRYRSRPMQVTYLSISMLYSVITIKW